MREMCLTCGVKSEVVKNNDVGVLFGGSHMHATSGKTTLKTKVHTVAGVFFNGFKHTRAHNL